MINAISIRRSLLWATIISASSPVLAQEAARDTPSAPPQAAAATGGVEDIVVTARKREESLQSVPVTITAFTAAALEKSDTRSIFDLATRTPGLYFGTTGGRNGGNKLQIRNFSTGTSGGSKASVFIDGVYMSGDYSSTPLANLERIEVLKGPQSAYFGRSTFVGAINCVTRDPGDDVQVKLEAIGATLGEVDVSGFVTTPLIKGVLSNTVSARGFKFRGPDAWVNKDGYHLGDQSTFAISDKVVLTPAPGVTLRWYNSYVYDRDHIPQTAYAPLSARNSVIQRPDGTQSYYFAGAVNIDHSRANAATLYQMPIRGYFTDPGIERNQYRSVLSAEIEVADHTLSGFGAYSDEVVENQFDASYLGARIEDAPDARGVIRTYAYNSSNFRFIQKSKDKQLEVRLTSPQAQRLRYTLGYNYTKLYGETLGYFDPVRPDGTRVNATPLLTTSTTNWIGGNPATTDSGFGGVYLDVIDQITASGEVRYQVEKITGLNRLNGRASEATYKTWLPRFNLQFKPSDDLQFYGVYSRGNNPGGFNNAIPLASLPAGVDEAYGEEKLDNYEIGVKSKWLDGRLVINAAVYRMIWNDQQVLQSYVTNRLFPGSVDALTTATSKSQVTGFEAEVDAVPADGLNLRATASYGKAKYKRYCSSNYYAVTGIATGVGCRSVAGFQQEGTPALQLSFLVDYTRPVSATWDAYVRADYQYQSKVYLEEWNVSWINPAHLAGLRIGTQSDHIVLEGFVRNLLNDDHSARITRATYAAVGGNGTLATPGFNNTYPAINGIPAGAAGNQSVADTARRPRQFGIRVAYKY